VRKTYVTPHQQSLSSFSFRVGVFTNITNKTKHYNNRKSHQAQTPKETQNTNCFPQPGNYERLTGFKS